MDRLYKRKFYGFLQKSGLTQAYYLRFCKIYLVVARMVFVVASGCCVYVEGC